MKRMINKLGYSYSSSESLSLSEQSYFCMDKTKQTKKAYDWVKLQTPGFLNIARLRPFASGYSWNKRSFSISHQKSATPVKRGFKCSNVVIHFLNNFLKRLDINTQWVYYK